MLITAAVLRKKAQRFNIEQLELDTPHPDEILVRVAAAGICHTDLTIRDNPLVLPIVLGHEGSGIVEQIGKKVTKVKPGDHVVLSFFTAAAVPIAARGSPLTARNLPVPRLAERGQTDQQHCVKVRRKFTAIFLDNHLLLLTL